MKALLVLALIAMIGGCSVAPAKPKQVNKGDFSYLNAYLDWVLPEKRRQHDIAAVSVMVLNEQKIIAKHHSGLADRKAAIPASDDTLYRIGSVTKLFTAISILQLVDAGKMSLDTPLQQYLPELDLKTPYGSDSVTVRQVLTHHSGLPSDLWKGFAENRALSQLIPLVNEQQLYYRPGEIFSYSNVGYALLGLAIEHVSGKTYPNYLKENIFAPLKLEHSIVGVEHDQLARAYLGLNAQSYPQIRDQAAGDIAMSAKDLATFAQVMLRNGTYQDQTGETKHLISNHGFSQMVAPQNLQSQLYRDMPMGLAWFLFYPRASLSGKAVQWHGGATHYFHSSLIILPEEDLAVIVLANSAEAYESVAEIAEQTTRIAYEAQTGLLWPEVERSAPHPVSLSKDQRKKLSGRYISPALGEIRVTDQGAALVAANDDDEVTLIPYSDGTLGVQYKVLGAFTFDNDVFKQLRLIPVEYQGQDVIKEQNGGVVAQKFASARLSGDWTARLGHYVHSNPDDLYDFSEITLVERDGLLRLTLHNERNDYTQTLYFNPVAKDRAIHIGLTRSSGDSLFVKTTPDKTITLRYLGMTFQQQSQQP